MALMFKKNPNNFQGGGSAWEKYEVFCNGKKSGPFSKDEIINSIFAKTLGADAMIKIDGTWVPIDDFLPFQNVRTQTHCVLKNSNLPILQPQSPARDCCGFLL